MSKVLPVAWLAALAAGALAGCCDTVRGTQTFAVDRDYRPDGGVGEGGVLSLADCTAVCISDFVANKPQKLFGCHLEQRPDGGTPVVICDAEYDSCSTFPAGSSK